MHFLCLSVNASNLHAIPEDGINCFETYLQKDNNENSLILVAFFREKREEKKSIGNLFAVTHNISHTRPSAAHCFFLSSVLPVCNLSSTTYSNRFCIFITKLWKYNKDGECDEQHYWLENLSICIMFAFDRTLTRSKWPNRKYWIKTNISTKA